jgi:hypothetical protein
MSRIDELKKQHPSYALSAIDIYKMMSPNQTNKYVEMLIKLDKSIATDSYYHSDRYRNEMIACMVDWGLDYNYLETFDIETLRFVFNSMNHLTSEGKIKIFTKFASYNERKLIENNDVTTYSTWDQIEQAVALADVKSLDKKLEKEIKKIYEDDEWLSLRPLSLEASMKYGANTKWCTTTNTGQYYARYSARGILIYNINKKTGYKVACFKNLDPNHDNEFSWWDVTDKKIEALDSEAPSAVLEAIRNEIKTTTVSNQMLMTKAEADKLEMYKDGNYRPGNYEEGPSLDRAYRSGGIIDHVQSSGTTLTFNSSPSFTTYTYNPETFTINSAGNVGIGTTTTSNTQLSVNGDMAIEGNIRFTSEGVERGRLTSEGNFITYGPDGEQYVNGVLEQLNPENYDREHLIQELRGLNSGEVTEPIPQKQRTGVDLQQLYNELNEVRFDRDEPAEDARWRLEQAMASQLAEANERVAQKHLSLLDNIELGTLDNDMKIKMQMLAGIKTNQQRIQEMDAEIKRLRSEEAQPEVVHSSIWNKIKNTGAKLGRRFTNRSRRQIGASPMSVSARLEAVKQSQEL